MPEPTTDVVWHQGDSREPEFRRLLVLLFAATDDERESSS